MPSASVCLRLAKEKKIWLSATCPIRTPSLRRWSSPGRCGHVPTIKFCIEMVKKKHGAHGPWEWSMMAKAVLGLRPSTAFEKKLPEPVMNEVKDLEKKILNGTFRVPSTSKPPVSD